MRTTIDIPEATLGLAKTLAMKDGLSLSDVVNKALDSFLPTSFEITRKGDSLSFHSGPTLLTQKMQLNSKIVEQVEKDFQT